MTNVAIVVLDTLRKDYFDDHFDWLPGRRFERAWSTGRYTVPAHASLFTGRYPSEIGVHAKSEGFDWEGSALAETLRPEGYRTTAISGNALVSPDYGFDRGFEVFHRIGASKLIQDDIFNWTAAMADSELTGRWRDIELILRCLFSGMDTYNSLKLGYQLRRGIGDASQCRSLLDRMTFSENEFLFVNLMDTHARYFPPRAYRTVESRPVGLLERFDATNTDLVRNQRQAYDDTVRYLSDIYESVFGRLREDFDYVVTLSDHGELLGEHGQLRHEAGLFEELIRIPLCISGDGIEDGSIKRVVSLLDVHRTVLGLLGVGAHERSRGRNLLSNHNGRSYLVEDHGLRESLRNQLETAGLPRERIASLDSRRRAAVLANGGYVYETFDGSVASVGDIEPENPRAALEDLVSEVDIQPRNTRHSPTVDEEVNAVLRDLGYL